MPLQGVRKNAMKHAERHSDRELQFWFPTCCHHGFVLVPSAVLVHLLVCISVDGFCSCCCSTYSFGFRFSLTKQKWDHDSTRPTTNATAIKSLIYIIFLRFLDAFHSLSNSCLVCCLIFNKIFVIPKNSLFCYWKSMAKQQQQQQKRK